MRNTKVILPIGTKVNSIMIVKIHQKDTRVKYECDCSCGDKIFVRSNAIHQVVNCGCNISDIRGQRFKRLEIVDRVLTSPLYHKNGFILLCKCDCGGQLRTSYSDLVNTLNVQCDVCKELRTKEYDEKRLVNLNLVKKYVLKLITTSENEITDSLLDKVITGLLQLYNHYTDGDITFEHFIRLSSMECSYCHRLGIGKKRLNGQGEYSKYNYVSYNGLDRVDSSIGHTMANCVVSCKTCNYAKMHREFEYFIRSSVRRADTFLNEDINDLERKATTYSIDYLNERRSLIK